MEHTHTHTLQAAYRTIAILETTFNCFTVLHTHTHTHTSQLYYRPTYLVPSWQIFSGRCQTEFSSPAAAAAAAAAAV